MKPILTVWIAVILISLASVTLAGPLALAVDLLNSIQLIDFLNGPLHTYGLVNVAPPALLQSVAVHPDGRIFAGDDAGNLYLVDLVNPGQSTPLGNLGVGAIEGLDFDGTDLYMVDGSQLHWVDYSLVTTLPRGIAGGGYVTSIALENANSAYTVNGMGGLNWQIWNVDPTLGFAAPVFAYTLPDRMLALDLASDGKYYGLVWTGKHYELDMVAQTATLVFNNGGADWTGVAAIDGNAVGACCIGDSPARCVPLPQGLCLLRGGIYAGDATTCATIVCGATPAQEGSWGGVKFLYR